MLMRAALQVTNVSVLLRQSENDTMRHEMRHGNRTVTQAVRSETLRSLAGAFSFSQWIQAFLLLSNDRLSWSSFPNPLFGGVVQKSPTTNNGGKRSKVQEVSQRFVTTTCSCPIISGSYNYWNSEYSKKMPKCLFFERIETTKPKRFRWEIRGKKMVVCIVKKLTSCNFNGLQDLWNCMYLCTVTPPQHCGSPHSSC